MLGKASTEKITGALLIGGANLSRQVESLKQKPRIVVGSAGRILELNQMKKLSMHHVKTIVIDEADRMLDQHNLDGLLKVVRTTLRDRQLLFFSATMDEGAIQKAKEIGNFPILIQAKIDNRLPDTIEHIYFICEKRKKIEELRKIIHGEKVERAIVFLNRPDEIEMAVKRLNFHKIPTAALYGGASKKERQDVLNLLRAGKIRVLIASDLAARGLDIKGLSHVIHFEVPENPTFYLHRAGRVGRMNKKGKSILLATENEVAFIKTFEKKYNIQIMQKKMKFGNMEEFQTRKSKK